MTADRADLIKAIESWDRASIQSVLAEAEQDRRTREVGGWPNAGTHREHDSITIRSGPSAAAHQSAAALRARGRSQRFASGCLRSVSV